MAMFIGLISFVGMVVFLILGIVGAVRRSEKTKKRFILTGVCFVLLIAAVSFSDDSVETEQAETNITEDVKKDEVKQEEPEEKEVVAKVGKKEEPVKTEPKQPKEEAKEETPKEEPKEEEKEEPELSASQQNAIRHAEQYISTMPFSKTGLIRQLEFEGYTKEDATFAVDNITVDWKEQAVKHAENYNEAMPMSKQGLIDQLIFEGHSKEDSEFAATEIGL